LFARLLVRVDCMARLLRSAENYQKILKSFVADPPKFFTFNDGFGENPPSSVKFAFEELLPAMFPERSQYELADAPLD
jgi:Stealth protein CR4, conserved region 4